MIIGQFFDYKPVDGEGAHPYLVGDRVKIIAVHRPDPDDEDGEKIFRDDSELEAAGGLQEGDWADVSPWLADKHRMCAASCDVDVCDLFDPWSMQRLLTDDSSCPKEES